MIKKEKINSDSLLIIGDSIEYDIEPAIANGCQYIYLNTRKKKNTRIFSVINEVEDWETIYEYFYKK
jgi:FMN phosphatase YigB (HAD superfamily)